MLDAVEPLRDDRGRVYGAVETSVPLRPIVADSERIRSRILVLLIGGAAILWLVLLPVTTRAARGIAGSWVPGRRGTLKAFGRALAHGEVELVYQPQVDPQDAAVHAVEALVRWRRGDQLRTPETFLPALEESPLMTQLIDRVLDLALAQLARWKHAGEMLRISVNISADDLADEELPSRVQTALSRHGIQAHELTVEVTETGILADPVDAQRVLTAIADLGVAVSVDDFGTGYASISRLHQLPINEIKVDRSFVTPTDERTRSYLTAIVRFGQSLGLRVVAEGVEDAPTLDFIAALGCQLIQGYHVSRPLNAEQIDRWLHPDPPLPAAHQHPASSPAT